MRGNHYLIESDVYLYCIPACDLRTVSGAAVEVGHTLNFKYGKNHQYEGQVLFIGKKEKEVLKELEKVKKERKKQKRNSFCADNPRKCVVKAREQMTGPLVEPSTLGELECKTASKKQKQDNKISAEIAMEKDLVQNDDTCHGSSTGYSTELDSVCDAISTGSSCSSSIPSLSCLAAESEANRKEDITHLQNLANVGNQNESSDADDGCHRLARTDSPSHYLENKDQSQVCSDLKETSSSQLSESSELGTKSAGAIGELSNEADEPNEQPERKRKKGRKSKKKSKKSRKSKKSKKRRRHSSTSSSSSISSSSSDSSSTSSDSSDEERPKKVKCRRNLEIFPGNNYLYSETSENVVKLHPKYPVYVKQDDIDRALEASKTAMNFVRQMVDKIYTMEALQGSTSQGFPARGRGSKHLKKHKVLPRLHPDGRSALLDKALEIEKDQKLWRPKAGDKVKEAFRGRVGEFKV